MCSLYEGAQPPPSTGHKSCTHGLGVFQRPLTLILLHEYRDTNGIRIVMQIGVYTTFCQKKGILLQNWHAPKSTRKRNTPEIAGDRPFPESAFSGVLRFRVLFGALLEGKKEHPKTQHTRKRRFWERSITCVFGCVAFSGALCSPLTKVSR